MKKISIEEIEKGTFEINISECSECYYLKVCDPNFPFSENQQVMLFKDLSNLDTVNKMLAIFGYEVVMPLIDFTKPLWEELRRLADEDDWVADWDYKEQLKYTVGYDFKEKVYMNWSATYFFSMGAVYFSHAKSKEIKYFLNEHIEEALKAMEL